MRKTLVICRLVLFYVENYNFLCQIPKTDGKSFVLGYHALGASRSDQKFGQKCGHIHFIYLFHVEQNL